MGPGKWGLEKSSGRDLSESLGFETPSGRGSSEGLGWPTGAGDAEDGEDHVAGLVERIAYTMLDEDDEETQQASSWGGSLPPLLRAQSAAQFFGSNWDEQRVENVKALADLPGPIQKRIQSEAMEQLYKELVRLKLVELTAAQQQLSIYQNAFMDSSPSLHSGFPSIVGPSNSSTSLALAKQHGPHIFYDKQLHRCSGGGDRSAPSNVHCQGNGRGPGQRIGAPFMYPSSRYLTRTSFGMPASRELGGTGVFLPRCRTGARNFRTHDSRRKPELRSPTIAGRPDTFLPVKAKENMADRSSLQYPSCSPLQEVAPDISLPTEWTY